MLVCCYVATEFHDKAYNVVFRVKREDLGLFLNAPDHLDKTLEYAGLVADGSLKVGLSQKEQQFVENNPMVGMGADGKLLEKNTDDLVDHPETAKTTRKTKKTEAADAQ